MIPVGGGPTDKDTLWALVYAQLESTDKKTGRRNFRHSYAYAFQGFYGSDGAVMIAWLANWVDWDHIVDFETAMTLPRQVLLGADRKSILTPPVDQVVSLRDRVLDKMLFLRGQLISLPNGTAEIKLLIDPNYKGSIRLSLVHPTLKNPVPGVEISQQGLEIISGAVDKSKQQAIEVYADGGLTTGTARLLGNQKFTQMQLSGELAAITGADVWSLKAAEMRGKYINPQS
uniref:Uncharacterized protein n=1 Tax=Ditylenchus dipsaci TaxID=166011 RepID=A0A915CZK5_9BILA